MRRYVCIALAATLASGPTFAQQPSSSGSNLHNRIAEAALSNSLLSSHDLKPWHLTLNVTFFDANGKNPYTGTIETWRSGEDSRTVVTVGSGTRTDLHTGGKIYVSQSGASVPALADDLLANFLNPGPSVDDIEHSTLELRSESFGKAKLDCVMLSQPIPHAAEAPMGLFPTYCLDPGLDIIRVSYNFGSFTALRNQTGNFHGKNVALDLRLIEGTVLRAEAKVIAFNSFTPADEFTPGADLKEVGSERARIAGGIIVGQNLTKVTPVYPVSAREAHVEGTVVLRAIIGRDGHIHSLRLVSAPDADLAISAVAAVRQWTYKPYLLNGQPTEVDTTITVNYSLN